MKRGACAKRPVLAIIYSKNRSYRGKNDCANPQLICPRKDKPPGVGYELCREICQQEHHAEIGACKKAGKNAEGGALFLYGHTYSCANCIETMKTYKISKLIIVENNYQTINLNDEKN